MFCGFLLNSVMTSRRNSFGQRLIMSGIICVCRTSSLLQTTIMLFISCSKLKFCEKEPTNAYKIEKTLSTMLPADRVLQQQYRANKYTQYSQLIHTLT
jgi:hypothetical protein